MIGAQKDYRNVDQAPTYEQEEDHQHVGPMILEEPLPSGSKRPRIT